MGGTLTLATCKPGIKKYAKIGEWIAGFTSNRMNGDKVGQERLVYLMQVQQIMSIKEFWDSFPAVCRKQSPQYSPAPCGTSRSRTLVSFPYRLSA